MVLVILLVIAVACYSQVLARGPLLASNPSDMGIQDYEQLPLELIVWMDAIDSFADALTLQVMESYFVKRKSKAVLCYRDQNDKYLALSKNFETNVKKAFQESTSKHKDQKKIIRGAQAPLKSITDYVHSLSELMWYLLKDKEFDQAVKLMQEYRQKIRENAAEFETTIEGLSEKYEAAKEFKEKYIEIRNKAEMESQIIAHGFQKCMIRKNPKAPTSGNGFDEDQDENEDKNF